ncbi:hypothetical protein [Hyalangium gracile]|uniref:hypothetical protein n=1 Tax=Hyalangium gracile TaxID=394092 RepID=UPI001CCF6615|nr:hypothetical protein [Hyalangium gracile]
MECPDETTPSDFLQGCLSWTARWRSTRWGGTLPALTHLSRLVIRGLESSQDFDGPEERVVVVEGSADGVKWVRLAEVKPFRPEPLSSIASRYDNWTQDTPFDVPLVDAPSVRLVKVFVQQARGSQATMLELAELSVFE